MLFRYRKKKKKKASTLLHIFPAFNYPPHTKVHITFFVRRCKFPIMQRNWKKKQWIDWMVNRENMFLLFLMGKASTLLNIFWGLNYCWSYTKVECCEIKQYPLITYYWTSLLILDHSYLVGNLTISKIAETKALEPLKSWHFCISNFRTC